MAKNNNALPPATEPSANWPRHVNPPPAEIPRVTLVTIEGGTTIINPPAAPDTEEKE
jgi:hypothetical protein